MSEPTTAAHVAAIHITNALKNQRYLHSPFSTPTWYLQALGSALILAGTDTPAAVFGNVDDTDKGEVASILIFTQTLVVIIEATELRNQGTRPTVRAIPRHTLDRVTVDGYSDPTDQDWPGRYRLELHYADGTEVTLPPDRFAQPEEYAAVDTLRPSLMADFITPSPSS